MPAVASSQLIPTHDSFHHALPGSCLYNLTQKKQQIIIIVLVNQGVNSMQLQICT